MSEKTHEFQTVGALLGHMGTRAPLLLGHLAMSKDKGKVVMDWLKPYLNKTNAHLIITDDLLEKFRSWMITQMCKMESHIIIYIEPTESRMDWVVTQGHRPNGANDPTVHVDDIYYFSKATKEVIFNFFEHFLPNGTTPSTDAAEPGA